MAERSRVLILADADRGAEVKAVVERVEMEATLTTTTAEALDVLQELGPVSLASVVCSLGTCSENSCWPLLAQIQTSGSGQTFIIVLSTTAAQDVKMRMSCFDAGANMVTQSIQATATALARVASVLKGSGPYACPRCGLAGLSENSLHLHMHFHHAAEPNLEAPCPICGNRFGNMAVHLHNEHGPADEREPPPAPFAMFAWCVCQNPRDGKFLLVNEPAGIAGGRPGYWLPAGRVDKGESLVEACQREALEEAGVKVTVTGLLRFMVDGRGTLRVVFLAVPENEYDCEPKSVPDWESVGALWADSADLAKLSKADYRSLDPADLYPKVASGKLKPQSLHTDAFQELEALVRRLTLGEKTARAELPITWKRLTLTYPASAFQC